MELQEKIKLLLELKIKPNQKAQILMVLLRKIPAVEILVPYAKGKMDPKFEPVMRALRLRGRSTLEVPIIGDKAASFIVGYDHEFVSMLSEVSFVYWTSKHSDGDFAAYMRLQGIPYIAAHVAFEKDLLAKSDHPQELQASPFFFRCRKQDFAEHSGLIKERQQLLEQHAPALAEEIRAMKTQ